MVGLTGIEPVTPSMSTKCSPAELIARCRLRRRVFIVSGGLLQARRHTGSNYAGNDAGHDAVGAEIRQLLLGEYGQPPAPARAGGRVSTGSWRYGWRRFSGR